LRSTLIALLSISFAVALAYKLIVPSPARGAISPDIVISQVYGGGGNSGAPFTNDFIELFNRGAATVNLSGWAIQYASSTGTSWQKTDLSGMLAPGKYYLIQQASGGATGSPLPSPDATGTISMAATAGKVVLTNNNTLIASGTVCPSGSSVVDIVGYGSGANCFEGAGPAPTISATTAAVRAGAGCTETDNNAADFAAGAVNPRNTALPGAVCGAQTNPAGIGAASPNPVAAGNVALLSVTITPGANPTSTGITVRGNLTAIGGAASQLFFDDETNGDANAGDNVFSFRIQVAAGTAPGAKTLAIGITDAQSRTGATNINLTVQAAPPPGNVVISQIFGGGGNSGAPFTHDFVELYNRGNAPVSLSGWSVQYAPSTSASWQKVDLAGTLAPGRYYLIQLASGGASGAPLPAPDATGSIAMASTTGKVALSNGTTLLNTSCPIGPAVVDFVGYGSSANCFEGSDSTPSPSSERAVIRLGLGCTDSNDNAADFVAFAPVPRNTASPANFCDGCDGCPSVGPGTPFPARSAVSDQKAGSVLIYPIYSSTTASLSRENARLNITNTEPSRRVVVHLFFIEDDSASIADAFVCLTPNQTVSILASDFDPDVTGYLIAVAVDERTGCPINFNFLIGDEYVKLSSGHAANLGAEAFAALANLPPLCNENATTAEINFDGISYNAAPRVLATSSIPSVLSGNSTLLVIDRIGGNLATGLSTISQIVGIAFDDMEHAYSFEFSTSRRQYRAVLSNSTLRTTPRLSIIIPAGRSGWLRFWRSSDGGLIGASINFNPNAAADASAFNQGHNLHKLTLTTESSFTMPVFPPNC
jgi:hypothetical protein